MTKMQKYGGDDMAVVVQQQMQAEVDMQVATAKRYPRDVGTCVTQAIRMATSSEEIAQACFYALERGGKVIYGPSIRLAEIIATTWGNIRAESKIVEEGEKSVTARGTVWDMEKNVMIAQEVKRSITTKHGKRYGVDMINTTSNAASSIALRNALFRVVPGAVVEEVYQRAREAAQGSKKPLKERRQQLLSAYQKLGISQEQVEYFIGDIDKIDDKKIDTMRGVYNRITQGEVTTEDWLMSIGWYDKDEVDSETQADEIMGKMQKRS
jgi:hypothetical protein